MEVVEGSSGVGVGMTVSLEDTASLCDTKGKLASLSVGFVSSSNIVGIMRFVPHRVVLTFRARKWKESEALG